MRAEVYRHSGRISVLGLLLMLIAGFATALVGGVVYTYIVSWIPIIYVNVIATMGFGAVIGFVVGNCSRLGKVRNNAILILLTLGTSMLALYVAWIFDCLARFGFSDGALLWHPLDLQHYISMFYKEGFWSMGRNEESMVSGLFLGAIWLAEAAAIIGISIAVAWGTTAALPFCEYCDCWTDRTTSICRLAWQQPSAEPELGVELSSGDLTALQQYVSMPQVVDGGLRIDICKCPSCDQSTYVTVGRVKLSYDKNGAEQIRTTNLITNQQIGPEQLEFLTNLGQTSDQSFVVAEEVTAELADDDFMDGFEPPQRGGEYRT
ncbi:MAG: hypothetical protein KDA85_12850 [Planctomycetaceae bacterium]|nr:hypothetical protein [Planctomycetaceae bacterium]